MKIAIIGGGFAGYAAAHYLKELGETTVFDQGGLSASPNRRGPPAQICRHARQKESLCRRGARAIPRAHPLQKKDRTTPPRPK